ncbi:serine hydrolase [Sphingopyxis panaciterrulae]|uniref:Beta-lactamase class A n=1 Tax=Sphingopyxis panaciterrulae TaxID=462372 RepID=A0A7W9ERM6_9SPHN|nr:serine hydrolase [Sphingopyxis panaciterrulae]MBB5706021.1 beta-lactamase class A [Sphingopyxis panaciterrulae]
MTRFLTAFALAAVTAMPNPAALAQQPPATVAPAAATPFDTRAAQLVDLMTGKLAFADYFAPAFQQAVPEAQFKTITANLVAQYGQPVAVESASSTDGRQGTVKLRFEKGVGTIALAVGAGPDQRVEGLRIQNVVMADDSFDRVAAELAALPGATGFLVAEVDGDAIRPIAAANADRQFAIGSTFKLYILDELAAEVAAGKRHWSDVVPLSHLSFSSAATANWPKDTPVTLQALANWMISVSDNGATDTLIHLLGRDAIEARMRAAGHSDPSRNIPFLTTVEAFALKGNNFADLRTKFIAADDRAQRGLLDANADRLVLANVDGVSFGGKPRFIDSLEWFATPSDLARVLVDLKARNSPQAMAALAINNGVGPIAAADWRYLGYKGGSELGVLSMSLFGQRKSDGQYVVVTASWNNPDTDVAAETLNGMVTRLLALAAK